MSILDDFLGDDSPLPSRGTLRGITDDLLRRQRWAESKGVHRQPDGSLTRNAKSGALGIAQIMPATGRSPGFGVAPLRDDTQAEHERFQRDYMGAMYSRYGDVDKALAAYNWGPGYIDRLKGDPNWLSKTPLETRNYVAKITGGVAPDVEQAVQATVEPKQPRQPQGSLLDQPPPDFGDWDKYQGIDTAASRARAQMLNARSRARVTEAFDAVGAGAEKTRDPVLDDFLSTPYTTAQPQGEVSWGDYGRALQSGGASLGQMVAGAGEWAGDRLDDMTDTQGQGVLSLASQDARRYFGGLAQEYADMMSPEAKTRMSREILTLDPTKTMWRGPGEFLSSAALKFTSSAPATIGPLLGSLLLSRIGLGSIAAGTYGASEGLLSLGGIQANIADEIDAATPEMLAESQRYQELVAAGNDDLAAREQLKQEATQYAPLIGGLVVGAVSAVAGKYLEPVFVEGRALLSRTGRGGVSEAGQEFFQSGAEQIAQNAAADVYDKRGLFEGSLEAATQGALIGGPAGAVMTGLFGKGPEPTPPAPVPPPPVPTDLDEIERMPSRADYGTAIPRTPYEDPDALPFDEAAMAAELKARQSAKATAIPARPTHGKYANVRPGMEEEVADEGLAFSKSADYLKQHTKGFAGVPNYTAKPEDQLTFTPFGAAPETQPLALPAPSRWDNAGTTETEMEGQDLYYRVVRRRAGEDQVGAEEAVDFEVKYDKQGNPRLADPKRAKKLMDQWRASYPDQVVTLEPAQRTTGPVKATIISEHPPAVANRVPPPAPVEQGQLDLLDWGSLGATDTARPAAVEDTSIPPEWNQRIDQPDLFAEPAAAPVPRPEMLAAVPQVSRQQVGREAVRYDDAGNVVERVPLTSRKQERKLLRAWERQYPDQNVRVAPVMGVSRGTKLVPSGQFAPDVPSAEPLSDLRGQLKSLQRGERKGVYLSPDNVARLKQKGQYVPLTNGVVPLENFDGKGGVMLVPNRAAAEEAITLSRGAGSPQEVIGALTGAGLGKPLDSDIVVQRLDEDGAVVQERLVEDQAEAQQVQKEWGEDSRIVSAKFAIRRRNQLIANEDAMLSGERKQRVRKGLRRAAGTRKAEQRRRAGELYAPSDVIFGENVPRETEEAYEKVYGEAVEAETAMQVAKTSGTVSESLKARARLAEATERGKALLALHPHRTQAAARAEQATKGAETEAAEVAREQEDVDRRRDVQEESRQERAQKGVRSARKTDLRRWAGVSAWLKVQNLTPKNRQLFEALWNIVNPQSDVSREAGTVDYGKEKNVPKSTIVLRARTALRQYITDVRNEILEQIDAETEQGNKDMLKEVHTELGQISEVFSKLGGSALTERAAPRAAFTATYRLLRHLNRMGEYGMALESHRDAILHALGKTPKDLLNALEEATVSRDEGERAYTMEELKALDEADLNRVYLRSLGKINTRITDGSRAALVEGIITRGWAGREADKTPFTIGPLEDRISDPKVAARVRNWLKADIQEKVRGRKHLTYSDLVHWYKAVTDQPLPKRQSVEQYLKDVNPSEKMKLILRMQLKEEQGEWGVSKRSKMAGLTRGTERPDTESITIDEPQLMALVATASNPKDKNHKVALSRLREEYERVVGSAPKDSTGAKGLLLRIKKVTKNVGYAKTKSRYNTKSLYDATTPRDVQEGSDATKKEHAKRHTKAVADLRLISAKVKAMLANPNVWSTKGQPIEGSTAAKLWLTWLTQYADMHLKVQGKSRGAMTEMEKLTADLKELAELAPEKRIAELNKLYGAESREQVALAAKSDPTILGDLRNPTVRAKWNYYSSERTRKAILLMRRMSAMFDRDYIERLSKGMTAEEIAANPDLQPKSWTDSVYWHNYIGPVLTKYAESLMVESMDRYAKYDGPTQTQREMIDWIMADWRKDPRYAPIDNLLKAFGYYDEKLEQKWNPSTRKMEYVGKPSTAAERRYRRLYGKREADRVQGLSGHVSLEGTDIGGTLLRDLAGVGSTSRPGMDTDTRQAVEDFLKTKQPEGSQRTVADVIREQRNPPQRDRQDNPRLVNALLTAWDINNAVGKFVAVVQKAFSSKQDIIDAERAMVEELRDVNQKNGDRMVKAGGVRSNIFKTVSPSGVYLLTYPHNMQEVNFRTFGQRLAAGKMTMTEVREQVAALWKKVELSDEIANRAKKAAGFALDLTGTQPGAKATQAEWVAAGELRKLLGAPTNLKAVLETLSRELGPNHTYSPLLRKLMSLEAHHDLSVSFDTSIQHAGVFSVDETTGKSYIRLNPSQLSRNPNNIIHAMLHEAVHAATMSRLVGKGFFDERKLLKAMDQLRQATKSQLGSDPNTSYAFTNTFEFVAEAFTNPHLQAELKKIKIADLQQSLWDRFVGLVRDILGLDPKHDNVLDAVLSMESQLFSNEVASAEQIKIGGVLAQVKGFDFVSTKAVRDYARNIMADSEIIDRLKAKARDMTDDSSFALGIQTMRQILKRYAPIFSTEGADNPMKKYGEAFFARVADSQRMLMGDIHGKLADGTFSPAALSNKWSEIKTKSAEQERLLSGVMTTSTMERMHPDKDFADPVHKHLTDTPEARATHAELRAQWAKLKPETQQFYKQVEAYYRNTIQLQSQLMALTALRTYMGDHREWKDKFNYTEDDIVAKKLDTKEGLQKEFGKALDDDAIALILKMANVPKMYEGPYFPLKRYGNFVTTAKKKVDMQLFLTKKDRAKWVEERSAADPTLVFKYSDEPDIRVDVFEYEMRTAETRTQANENKAELRKQYGEMQADGTGASDVLLKASLYETKAAIPSGAALNTLLGKLDGNPAAQNAMKEFYLQSLHDASFRKTQMRRKTRKGVDASIQHRAFADYAKSASYYSAQLRHGHKMATALAEMKELAGNYRDNDIASAVKAGQVVKELVERDKLAASPFEVNKWTRRGIEYTQFMMLTSPSYWGINATQPYLITLPWLSAKARGGVKEATAALTNAQALIAHPILKQTFNTVGGVRAFFNRKVSEEAYTVLSQVESQIRARAGGKADSYIDMLETLKRESIIDMSMQSEIRDIANGEETSYWNRLMDASRVMAHVTEVNNRIMTALAAYDVALGQGLTHEHAVKFARDAVAETQYDYSAANKPRVFSAQSGPLRPMFFQFMQYTQHTYALMIEAFGQAWSGETPEEKTMGRKILGGLLLQHALVGGLTAATIQPLKWAIGLALMALPGGDDEDETWLNVASGVTYERWMRESVTALAGNQLGEVIAGGLPRLIDADISNRMALGQLYFVDLNPETAETFMGSAVLSFAGPLASIAGNHIRAAKHLKDGETQKAFELVVPKMVRDFSRAARYYGEGVTDSTGKVILDSDALSPLDLFWQSVGVGSADVSETYARNQAVKDKQQFVNQQKAAILREYRNADSPSERRAAAKHMREVNRKYHTGMTYSDLIKSRKGKAERERSIQKYGATLSPRERRYADEGDPYNVPEE